MSIFGCNLRSLHIFAFLVLCRYLLCEAESSQCFYWTPSFTLNLVSAPSMPGNFGGGSMIAMAEGREVFVVGGYLSGSGVQQTAVFKDEGWSMVKPIHDVHFCI